MNPGISLEYVVNFSANGNRFLLNYEGEIEDGIYIANFNGEASSSKKFSDITTFFIINPSPDKRHISVLEDNLFARSLKIISTTPEDTTQQDVTLWKNDNPLDSQGIDHYDHVGWSPDSKTDYISYEFYESGNFGCIIRG